MDNVTFFNLPKITDPRGNLTFIQFPQQVPFEIKRVFWTYNVPSGQVRGGHAYKTQREVLVALSGSFDVVITDKARNQSRFHLNRSHLALLLPTNTWRHLENFSTNAISLHLSSDVYNVDDYIRNFDELID